MHFTRCTTPKLSNFTGENLTMKYRRLTLEELTAMQTEFVQFLASQSIPAEDWEQMKDQDPKRAEQMIEVFSDIVLEKVLEKIDLLEMRQKDKLMIVKCNQEGLKMRGLQIEGNADFDLSKSVSQEKMEAFLGGKKGKIQLLSGEKTYKLPRGEEVFGLLQQGYLISKNQQLFENLAM